MFGKKNPFERHIQPHEQPPTVEGYSRLLFLSFRYSQGDADCQRLMYRYVRHLHPEWQGYITENFLKKVGDTLRGQTARYLAGAVNDRVKKENTEGELFHRNLLIAQDGTRARVRGVQSSTVTWEMGIVEDELRTSLDPDSIMLIKQLSEKIVERDTRFFELPGGRPRDPSVHEQGAAGDPYLSHLCYYGFAGNDAGAPEYNRMFKDVAIYLRNQHENPSLRTSTEKIISAYNEHHPVKPLKVRFASVK